MKSSEGEIPVMQHKGSYNGGQVIVFEHSGSSGTFNATLEFTLSNLRIKGLPDG
jgi:hypothetical protein